MRITSSVVCEEPLALRDSVAGSACSYASTGNTTARGSESLFYGDHDRLVSGSGAFGMSHASYQHDACGERVMKISVIGTASMIGEEVPPNCLAVEGQSVQTFLYDEAGRLIRDQSDPCAARPTNYEFVWLDDQPLAVIDADPNLPSPQLVGHITSDHLHTPRAIGIASGTACAAAVRRRTLAAVAALRGHIGRLRRCMAALAVRPVRRAQLWQGMRWLERIAGKAWRPSVR